MAVYCFRCPECDAKYTSTAPDHAGACSECKGSLVRDYKAEGVGLGNIVELRRQNAFGSKKDVRDLFLPTAEDYKGPSDPDGSKGLRAWNEEHGPKPGNTAPLYPDVPKKVW